MFGLSGLFGIRVGISFLFGTVTAQYAIFASFQMPTHSEQSQCLSLSGQSHLPCIQFWCITALILISCMVNGAQGYGSMASITASFGEESLFCAIAASGKQQVMCWGKNSSSAATDATSGPSLAALSGGREFICGLKVGTFYPMCWRSNLTGTNLVPLSYQNRRYSHIASGQNHVCGIRSSSDAYPGMVDCWSMQEKSPKTSSSALFTPPSNLSLISVVAGDDFTCGLNQEGSAICWGSPSNNITTPPQDKFESIVSGSNHVCGILKETAQVKCWGESMNLIIPYQQTRYMALAGGAKHSCGIRLDNHAVECWGSFNQSSIPGSVGFLAIAASNVVTCGIREANLIVDCWGSASDYDPPLQLCSPGLCSNQPCPVNHFLFNVSVLGLPDLMTVCLNKEEYICSPCADNCPSGFFLSNPCTQTSDRVCTSCSLCQNSSCQAVCADGSHGPFSAYPPLNSQQQQQPNLIQQKQPHMTLAKILGVSISGAFLLAFIVCFVPCLIRRKRGQSQWFFGKRKLGTENQQTHNSQTSSTAITAPWLTANDLIRMQAFRLAELRDATNGFKEFNELGRGSYGFVYKAVLPDGRQVAVKRANAARRIHSNSRDFEAELEVLCKLRHGNLVNLLGYCEEMGERLLVYEFMPHGTLHDHLHGGLSPLSWNLRLKISIQAARGIEYLHKDALPPVVHRDIKPSNILLDAEWGARVADFGLTISGDKGLPSPMHEGDAVYIDPDYYKSQSFTEKSDVYSFGVVLLEILSGRKAYDTSFDPSNIVQWAVPLISKGKSATILDRIVDLPRNVEPLLRIADIAELSVRFDPNERPTMSDVAAWLEQLSRNISW
ncbi:serine/threonine-protein kinase-like protein CCR1 [Cryptomeria japonica]|uniref:serine/threonine-protein kinase-like protein CCR1 n=1 Tax=Cryptomeria japonica TaxID=3369 RepID=UPI0027DA1D91|nr:serine/threonine-protein kinase-like protein CCR1 [Cryptomeria japonica]XP_057870105.2 serine/threonine-protein kinase-like protein CCR1 [Cryptomeria japonica]